MILSLQGCMAAGKTTAARYLQAHAPNLHICFEDNAEVIAEVRRRGLEKTRFEDYLEIQRLWLRHEMQRYQEAAKYPCAVMDFGAEEIEFYTLHYPLSIGKSWPVAAALQNELTQLQKCMPARILFLDGSEEVLRRHKEGDAARSREFFEHYLAHLLPLKKQWFFGRENVDVLCVDGLSAEEAGQKAMTWAGRWCGGGFPAASPPQDFF